MAQSLRTVGSRRRIKQIAAINNQAAPFQTKYVWKGNFLCKEGTMRAAARRLVSPSSSFRHAATQPEPLGTWTSAHSPSSRTGPQWIFLGCPGVGKGIYASRLAKFLSVPHIAMGDVVRQELSQSTPSGLKLLEFNKETVGKRKRFEDIIVGAGRTTSFSFGAPRSYVTYSQLVGASQYPESAHTNFFKGDCISQLLTRQRVFINWRHISSTTAIQHQEIGMPSLSPTMTQGNIAKWRKKEGDKVAPGDVLCEIETDKATLEMEVMDEGFLAKILCGDGSKDIPVGQPIAVVVDSEDEVAKFKDYKTESGGSAPPPPKKEDPPAAPKEKEEAPKSSPAPPPTEPPRSQSKPTTSSSHDRVFASPLARKIAEEKNVPLTSLKGTGPEGRIIKADVEEFLASGATSTPQKSAEKPLESLDFTDMPNTQIRRITAQRLLLSKQTIPHYYLTIDTRVDNLLALRSKLNSLQEASGGKRISINDFVLKAAAMALRKVPECNSSWTDEYIRQYHNVNISVAVQTDFGLLVPVVQNADKKGLATIAEDVKTLADKAKKNSLKPADYEGGTFTVSNLGGPFGVKQFCAIINPPQACILAVGTTDKRVVSDSEGEFTTATYMSATLSCDHRVVDGAIGARWLGAFKGYIEDPMTLLL